MKNNGRTKALSLLLCLAMLLSLVPIASLTAFAGAAPPYADLENTTTPVNFDGKDWYLIEDNSTAVDAGTVTLLSKECVAASKYDSTGSSYTYSGSTVETCVNNWYTSNISADAKAAVNGSGMFLLTTDWANALSSDVLKCSQASGADMNLWWLCSPGGSDEHAACVYGNLGVVSSNRVSDTLGVRPALKLDLSKVEFNSEAKTFAMAKSAYADCLPAATDDADALAAKVVKFNGHDWYLIEDNSTSETEGTVTLFAADTSFGATKFNSTDHGNKYSISTVISYLDGMTETGGAFADVADAIEIVTVTTENDTDVTAKLYLLSKSEAGALPANVRMLGNFTNADYNGTAYWLRSPDPNDSLDAAYVYCPDGTIHYGTEVQRTLGVRPALNLDLSKVEFDSETKTFALPQPLVEYPLWVGGTQVTSANASNITGAKTPVASFDAETYTLTLAGANITEGYDYSGGGSLVGLFYAGEEKTLNIKLADGTKNSIKCDDFYEGIYSASRGVVFSGEGSLDVAAREIGIDVSAEGMWVNGGTLNVSSAARDSVAVYSEYDLTVNGGEFNASNLSNGSFGIATSSSVKINGGKVTASGGGMAIVGTVNNAVAGTGWTDAAGTTGKATIAVSTTGQSVDYYKKLTFAPHTHVFTYSADGATITATCKADGCTLDDGTEQHKHAVTLTIVKPTLTTYGQTGEGISASATLTGLTDFNTATGLNVQASSIIYWNAKIREGVYKTDGDQPLTAAPTSAGNYLAKITVNNCIAAVGYTIAKANPAYTTPTGLTATYGQTLKDVTLPTGWAWANGTQSVGSVGTNTFKANFTPTDTNNYNTVSGIDVKVTVGKTAGKTVVISTDTMTYNYSSIYIEGVAGQEYVIVPKGTAVTDADWNTSVKPDPERDNWVFFEKLNEATEYEIYTRTAETDTAFASEAVKANVYTTLSSISYDYDSTLVGASITVEPESDVEGLTYKWYQDEVTEDGEGAIHHNLTEIKGATGSTYTFRTEDAGKHIAVKIFAGDSEVGDFATDAPVVSTAKVIFDSKGGSDVETLTGAEYQSKIKAPADPTREGFAFDGWYWDEEFETPFDFEKDVITWNETTLYAKWTPNDYKITSVTGLSGANGKQWTKGGKDAVVFTVKVSGEDNSFDRFTGVKLDGKKLVKDVDYTAKKGSTVVTLKPETLEKLSVGEHNVTILFNNGEVNTTLTVLAASGGNATSPKTGDNSNLGLWIALMMLSLCALATTLFIGKKKRVFDR